MLKAYTMCSGAPPTRFGRQVFQQKDGNNRTGVITLPASGRRDRALEEMMASLKEKSDTTNRFISFRNGIGK